MSLARSPAHPRPARGALGSGSAEASDRWRISALIAPNITRRLLATFADQKPGTPAQPLDPLTGREEEVLSLVAGGRSNAEIAAELHISLSTVKTHVASLMTKLGARNRVEIAMWAYDTRRV